MSDVTVSCTDLVREVLTKTLQDFSTTLGSSNDATDEENYSIPTSNKPKLFDVLISEMCGHVNDDLRHLWYVSCDCKYDEKGVKIKEVEYIKEMNTNTLIWLELYGYLLECLVDIRKDPYFYLNLDVPSTEGKPKTSLKERLYSPIHIPGDEPIVVLGPYSTFLCKSDFEKICWSTPHSAARTLCGLVFSREKILQTDFINTFLEPYKIVDIESCILTTTYSRSEDILKSIARKCYDTHCRFKNRRLFGTPP